MDCTYIHKSTICLTNTKFMADGKKERVCRLNQDIRLARVNGLMTHVEFFMLEEGGVRSYVIFPLSIDRGLDQCEYNT